MTNVLLTSENFVRTQTVISDNVDSKYLLSSIRECQEFELQEILGTALYEKLIKLVSEEQINNTSNVAYKALLDTAQYFLAYGALVKLCTNTTFKISNIGLNTTTDENVQVPSTDDVFRIAEHYQHKADFYCERLQNYVLKHRRELPEVSDTNIYEIQHHLNKTVSNGLYLGGRVGKNGYRKCHRHK